MNDRADLRALTGARGIAAWVVVLYHIRLSVAGLPQGIVDVLAKGYLAVDFFFLLSGFVLWMTWGERLREGGWRAVPGFLKKRVARIWPLHAMMLAYAVALALLLSVTGRPDAHFPASALPAHLLLIQGWGFGADTLVWNDPAWTISVELFAYLLFPLIAMRFDWRRCSSIMLIGLAASAIVGLAVVWHALGVRRLGEHIPQLGLIRCIIQFSCGTIVGALWLRWRDRWMLPTAIAALVAGAVAAAFVAGMLPEPLAVPTMFAAVLLVLALTSGRRGNPLESNATYYLGQISFATYLGHSLLWKTFKLAFVDDPHAVPPALIALYLLLVIVSSIALYHLVERPAQRTINRWHPRRPLAQA